MAAGGEDGKQGGRGLRRVDLAFSTLGDTRDNGGVTTSEVFRAYAAALVRGGRGVAAGRVLTAPVTSRARTALLGFFDEHPDLRLRHIYFVGHGRAEGFAFDGMPVPMIANAFHARDDQRALSPAVSQASRSFWEAVRGKMVVANNDLGPMDHEVDFRACDVGAGPLVRQLAEFLAEDRLRGRIYSVNGDFDFQPVFAARDRPPSRLLHVDARVRGGTWVSAPQRPAGPGLTVTTPFGR